VFDKTAAEIIKQPLFFLIQHHFLEATSVNKKSKQRFFLLFRSAKSPKMQPIFFP
jgi:hypothetical protein